MRVAGRLMRLVSVLGWICLGGLVLLGCALRGTATDEPAAGVDPAARGAPVGGPEQTPLGSSAIRLWALEAEASSEFAVPEWGADKAAGPADAPGCGDYPFAWASAASDSIATLTLTYGTAVVPLEIRVIQSFNPDQVVRVEVFNPDRDAFVTVLEKPPEQIDRPCPYVLRVSVEGIDYPVNRIRITIDQSQLGLGWNEIDAVELIGRSGN